MYFSYPRQISLHLREEMIRVFREAKWSEVFDDGSSSPEQWFHYEKGGEFPGELVFNVDSKSGAYDATGQQATASYSGYLLQQTYDGDRLRVKS